MLNSVFITLPGKYVIQRRMEAISNNLANSQTAGYKLSRPSFEIKTSDETETKGRDSITLPHTTLGEMDNHIYFDEAAKIETGNRLDVAIEGSGFFVINSASGTVYTRNGQFTLDGDRKLVTMDGSVVVGQTGAEIICDGKEVVIAEDGSVYVDRQQAGQLKIVDFKDKTALRNQGKSYFVNTSLVMQETAVERPVVKSGFYESSNVNVMTEMIDMMTAMRAYESYAKTDQALNDVMSKLLDIQR